jgi:hypothetical protein
MQLLDEATKIKLDEWVGWTKGDLRVMIDLEGPMS